MESGDAQAAFWRGLLAGFSAPSSLVVDRPAERGLRSGEVRERASLTLAGASVEGLVALSGGDTGAAVEAAFGLLLARYAGEEYALFGVLDEGVGGVPLPARIDLEAGATGSELVGAVVGARGARAANAATALEEVRALSSLSSGAPLFEALLVPHGELADPELPWGRAALVIAARPGDDPVLEAAWDPRRLEREPAERLLGHLAALLTGLAADPERAVAELPLLTADERQQILYEWNATEVEFPSDVCLHEQFEQRARMHPDGVAVVDAGGEVTYAELNRRANRLAHHLCELGVGPDVPVGISLERSAEMVVGLLAITKAGGGYVPLDPTYPRERLTFLAEDSGASVLVTQSGLASGFEGGAARLVLVDADAEAIAGRPDDDPESGATPESLAYLIYTSGSTGRPKGVVLNHRGRVNNFADFNRRYEVRPGDRLLALASLSFDMCAYDVFGTLAAGATIVVADTAGLDPGQWARAMVEHQVTLWHSVPALLEMMISHVEGRPELHPKSLRLILLGGDWVPVSLPDRVKAVAAPGMRAIVMGGATECSMDSTIYEVETTDADWKSIPYGAPMWNQRCYVLDRNRQPVPVGVPAELYLGGVGVGDGYHQRPDLSAEKFLPDPFVDGERVYKTGDLARWRPDGNLELLGRMDFQVKIRGFRIELGEIEASLREHAAVRECVLVAREDEGREKRLVAYVIPDPEWSAAEAGPGQAGKTEELVGRWASVYDSAYGRGTEEQDPTFNIASWDSSYTGGPIPAEEMHEWVDRIVERVVSLGPRRVLEIGCGTGLLLFRIAPHCERYVGTDISRVALDHLREHLPDRDLEHVELFERGGDDFSGLEPGSIDAVILNSIVMDFPGPEYLERVLAGAARVVAPGGFIFVGDVRDLRTLEQFSSSVQLHRAPGSWTPEQVRDAARKQIDMEEELVIDPGFFAALRERIPEISHVEVAVKRGRYQNEMVRYRYNATLFVGAPGERPAMSAEGRDWDADGLSLDELRRVLGEEQPEQLAVVRIPNTRTRTDARMLAALSEGRGGTAEQLRAERDRLQRDDPGVEPEDLWALADELPYAVDVRFAASGELDRCDAVFVRADRDGRDGRARMLPYELEVDASAALSTWFNDPLSGAVQGALTPDLRAHLAQRLPPYMVPAAFVYLGEFPLSPNGKINRRALPEPDRLRPELEQAYLAPRTPLEEVLAGIWAEGLGLDRVGMRDGFVQLGGNSLLATQLVSRLRDVFSIDLPLKLCLNLTLEDLAGRLEAAGREADVDVAQVAAIFMQISELSDGEVQTLLEEGVSGA